MNFINREQWGARTPKSRFLFGTVDFIFIHHTTGVTMGANQSDQWVKNIQNLHMDHNGWADIAYSFLYDAWGNVFEGRGWGVVGAHTLNYNSRGHGFAYMGDGSTPLPDKAQESLKWLIGESDRRYGKRMIEGHRDVFQTECPGNWLYDHKQDFRGNAPTSSIPMPGGTVHYDPPIVLEPIVSSWTPPEGGVLQLTASGAIYAWGGAQYRGAPNQHPEYWSGRVAHHLESPNADELAAGKVYVVVANSNEKYAYP